MKKGANNSYLGHLGEGISSLLSGLKLTLKHLWDARKNRKPIGVENPDYFVQDTGIVTLQYPYESIPVPDNGRYRLHNEMDDCIVCDLCAKICPVSCIDIEPIKSTEEIGKTSDGSTKRIYAAKFDIDMAKCCYCGLCTTVCPTECLTMTKTYDYSEFDIRNMVYHFTDLSPDKAAEKKKDYEEKQKLKTSAKVETDKEKPGADTPLAEGKPEAEVKKPAFKPVFKPVIKPVVPPKKDEGENENQKQ
jgi:formate hydrogenlyase subunit 6/NADH:ubiquinone oxidoreductase subunit I